MAVSFLGNEYIPTCRACGVDGLALKAGTDGDHYGT